MTTGWSLWIVILTIVNILACFWLLRWTSKPRTANEKIGGGADTGHVWDKDLREYNNPLPQVVAVAVLHHDRLRPAVPRPVSRARQLRRREGLVAGEPVRRQERAAVEAKAQAILGPLAAMPVAELVNNEQAMQTARNLYLQNCAQCHGSDGGGAKGFPNLANADWQWGGDADAVVATIPTAASRRA